MDDLVELIDFMGDDLTVVNSARVSVSKNSNWLEEDGKKYLNDKDIKLLRYLAKEHHWTPFSHCMLQFRIKMPIFVARQWFKSSVGFTRNEVSRRYVDDQPECYLPTEWRLKAENVKQGSSKDIHPESIRITNVVRDYYEITNIIYNELLEEGICAEQARIILPVALYTEFIETGSLFAYWRLYSLRNSKTHAQLETANYAEAIREVAVRKFPNSWRALEECW